MRVNDNRTPAERGEAFDRNFRVKTALKTELTLWTAKRALFYIRWRLAVLAIAFIAGVAGLLPILISSGGVGLLVALSVVCSACYVLFYDSEDLTRQSPFWNDYVPLVVIGILLLFLIVVPASSVFYAIGVQGPLGVLFGWPILGAIQSLRNIERARSLIAAAKFLQSLPKGEVENAKKIIRNTRGIELVYDSKL